MRKHAHGILQNLAKIKIDVLQLHLAGFDLRKIQNVVDNAQKGLRGAAHRFRVSLLPIVQTGIEQQLDHAEDAIHGGAYFVADIGQEL